MNIPLDRLYHYIESVAQQVYKDDVLIYRFYPHGSKNIQDLNHLVAATWQQRATHPSIWCHDQEPLNHEFYKTHLRELFGNWIDTVRSLGSQELVPTNLNWSNNIFDKNVLLHSERRSGEVEKYQNNGELITVYYWSHAVIARDWFRYAEHESFKKCTKKTFLIYNRAWSGTREYRLRFSDLLIERGLIEQCQTTCNPLDPESGQHYDTHEFVNTAWRPHNQLEQFLTGTTATSASSADFNQHDYNSTDIEVVLETLFDDERLHLTEKSLRPIACAQPFIIVAPHGSLEYLRSYGFKTFDGIWNEDYDQEQDAARRLGMIADLIQTIADWNPDTRESKLDQARDIAKYNQEWFFSKEFFNMIIDELKTNLKQAFQELDSCNNYTHWVARWNRLLEQPGICDFLDANIDYTMPSRASINNIMQLCQSKLALKNS
jgi:hypothetical protein